MNLPDVRGWALLGLFALAFYIFTLIALNPLIANVQVFGVLATAIISGGLMGAVGYFFGASKTSTDAADSANKDPNP